ncbi:ankyrin repeat domain-containing protein [Thermaerobacter subterraneus]|uniref:ankyrin repeat domain-containing protein n=1 Tax=Thermaerobacter subterraneus TaxID=175696 RepID=UPI000A00123F
MEGQGAIPSPQGRRRDGQEPAAPEQDATRQRRAETAWTRQHRGGPGGDRPGGAGPLGCAQGGAGYGGTRPVGRAQDGDEPAARLLRAGRDGRREEVLALLAAQPGLARVTAATGMTPLHHAARHGWAGVAQRLLDLGADPDAVNRWGLVPLHYAARYGHGAVVELLLDRGARPDVAAAGGQTPLDWAIVFGHPQVARLLVERGAAIGPFAAAGLGDVVRLAAWVERDPGWLSARNDWQGTLLHVAALAGQREAVRWLLDRGADPRARDARQRTPGDHARDPVIRRWLAVAPPEPAG